MHRRGFLRDDSWHDCRIESMAPWPIYGFEEAYNLFGTRKKIKLPIYANKYEIHDNLKKLLWLFSYFFVSYLNLRKISSEINL